ncbi:MAG: UDP-glucuronic acid decarboxylase family protein [Myxococcota bacterium]
MRCLVTGGSGFLGSHLCDRLLAEGHDVVALDNFYTGPRQNLAHLADHARFRLVEHDVRQPFPSELGDFDRLYHLACPASPPRYQRDPIFTLQTGVLGTLHVLELAERTGARFFQASTSEVYGDPQVHPQPEGYRGAVNPVGPRSCYDESKRAGETACMDFHRHRGVDVRIARIFNTYGPRMDPGDGRVVSNFLVQALQGEPLTVYGDGTQTRSFCYVDDLLDGFVALMESDVVGPVNLGNPLEHTLLELVQAVRAVTGADVRVDHRPLPEDDPKRRCPDITLARNQLAFEPRVSLEAGLERTAESFRRHLAN